MKPMIRKLKSGEYRLYSRKKDPKTGRRRNLGTFTTRAAAEKHERAVQFFKRAAWADGQIMALASINPATLWITLHEIGNVTGFVPILVMDVWEHAFILDCAPADRSKYIEAFFSNVDWDAVQGRITQEVIVPAAWS
jgi:superoxide dismutase